ncbi:MAG TPA: cytochrome c, partial [Thauera aminoaromatica]|nr:cytochrome c [Thauera aminoaromatica]
MRTVLWGLLALIGVQAMAKEWSGKIPSADERGRELYDRHCRACHGAKAGGDGLVASSLRQPVPNFTEGFGGKAQDELVRVVLHGRGAMPGFDTALSKDDAEKVVRYMGALGRAPGPLWQIDPAAE